MDKDEDGQNTSDGPTEQTKDLYAATAVEPGYSPEDTEQISWTASEFIEHQKNAGWFMLLALASLVLASIVYWMTKDWFGPVIIALLAIVFGIGAARKPRVLEYMLDDSGLTIGGHHYPYEDFRAFTFFVEGAVESIQLLPTKRWMPPLSIYYAPENADKISDTLSSYIPLEERQLGYIDRFLHKIRF